MDDRLAIEEGAAEAGAPTASAAVRAPLYHQIFVIFRDKIVSGELAVGDVLPSEQEIARAHGVSRITAKRAMDELAAAGMVVRERGRGTTVCARPSPPPMRASVEGWLENVSLMGLTTEARVLTFGYVPASEEVAAALKLEVGTAVQRAVRVRWLDGETMSYLTTFVPEEIGRSFTRADLDSQPLLTLLERCGVVVDSAKQIITATVADTIVAAALGVHVGAALLEVRRIVYDQKSRPVEYIRVLYRPERYHFEMLLTRVQGRESNSWFPVPSSDEGAAKLRDL